MLIAESSSPTSGTPDDVWELWSHPPRWVDWDPDVEAVEFRGAFVVGASGRLKPRRGPKVRWRLDTVDEPMGFVDTSRLPGCRVRFIHQLTENGTGVVVTHRIEMVGLTAPFFGRLLGPRLAPALPEAVANVARMAGELS